MTDRQPPSIRKQLLLMAAGLLFVIASVTFWAADKYGQRAAQLSYDRLLTGAALQMAENIFMREGLLVVDLPHSAFETLSLAPDDRAFYKITGPDKEHITGYQDLPEPLNTEPESIVESRSEQTAPFFYNADYSNEPVRFLVLSKLLTETDYTGEILIQVGHTLRARQALAKEISLRALQFVSVFLPLP